MTLSGEEEPGGREGGAKVRAFWATGKRLAFTLNDHLENFSELLQSLNKVTCVRPLAQGLSHRKSSIIVSSCPFG